MKQKTKKNTRTKTKKILKYQEVYGEFTKFTNTEDKLNKEPTLNLYNQRFGLEPMYVGKLKDAKEILSEMQDYFKERGVTCVNVKNLCLLRRKDIPIIIVPDRKLWDNMVNTLKLLQPLANKININIKANPVGTFRLVQITSSDNNFSLEVAKLYLNDESDEYAIGFGAFKHFVELDSGWYRRHWGNQSDKLVRDAR